MGLEKEMSRISYSQISMFNECPHRWKLNYVDKLKISESNIYLIFGTAMHEVIQTHLEVMLKKDIKMVGYLDIVILDEIHNTLKIIDIKTSTMGWNKWMKKDENKTQQLLLYKQFYSKQYNHPVDKIDVEYFIVKRKLWEKAMFPQKRVQKFSPASGTVSMNKVAKRLDTFLDLAFDDEGERISENIIPTPSKKACRWCEFRGTEYCNVGIKS